MTGGTVYTETVVHIAPSEFVQDAPYQVAIIIQEDGSRLTARIEGERVAIGDAVAFIETRNGVPYFRKRA